MRDNFMKISKSEWRKKLLTIRNSLDAEDREHQTQCVTEYARKYIATFPPHTTIALYHPVKAELNILDITDEPYTYCLPVIVEDKLVFFSWNPEAPLIQGAYGIAQPDAGAIITPEVLFIPLLGVDKYGYRLGYGKGYYDRYLAQEGKKAQRIGLAFTCQQVDQLPHEPHDIPLHALITANGITWF